MHLLLRAASLLLLLGSPAAGQAGDPVADSVPRPYRTRFIGLPYVSYTPQTKLQFGIAGGVQFKWPGHGADLHTRPSFLAMNLAYTTKQQWLASFSTVLFAPGSDWMISTSVDAGFFPLFYYGVGPGTVEADSNLMEHRFLRFEARTLRRLRGDLFFGPFIRRHAASDLEWQEPSRIPADLPGGAGGASTGFGATLLVDGRNSQTTPTGGHYLQADYLWHDRLLGGDFRYGRVALDARAYLPVRRGRDVIAVTLYGEFNGAGVPIQSMALLSNFTSQELMRGVYLGRFRDRHQVVAQADYRGHLKGRFGYVVYGSSGNVFGSPGSDLLDDLKFTYGAGLRFNVNPADPLNIRIDYTLTSFGGGGLSLGAAEAF